MAEVVAPSSPAVTSTVQPRFSIAVTGIPPSADAPLDVLAPPTPPVAPSVPEPPPTLYRPLEPYLLAGDLSYDGIVDVADLASVAAAFNTVMGDPGYDLHADLNKDFIIDIFDLVEVGVNYGRSLPGGP